MEAQQLVNEGRVEDALQVLQDAVRKDPADPALRVFLFQLLCIKGNWDRAMTQLNVAAEMDEENLLLAQVGRQLLNAEALRAEVFNGTRQPMIFGEPDDWVSWLVEANRLAATGKLEEAATLRARVFEAAPAIAGTIDDASFEWMADADPRLGPTLEAIVDGRYYWIPMNRLKDVRIDEPTDLRDLVWATATFQWSNGGESVGFIPARYVGTEASADEQLLLGRRTEWAEHGHELFTGMGQRMLATDQDDHPLLQIRSISFDVPETEAELVADAPAEASGG